MSAYFIVKKRNKEKYIHKAEFCCLISIARSKSWLHNVLVGDMIFQNIDRLDSKLWVGQKQLHIYVQLNNKIAGGSLGICTDGEVKPYLAKKRDLAAANTESVEHRACRPKSQNSVKVLAFRFQFSFLQIVFGGGLGNT